MHLLQYFDKLSLKPDNAKELKGLILDLAIRGRLTEEWRKVNPDVEPASVLLKKIKEEKAQLIKEKKIRKEKPLPQVGEEEIPFELPKDWNWSCLGNLGYTQTGNTPPKKNPEFYGNYIPFIGPANISNTTMEYPESGLSKSGLKKGRLIPQESLMMVCIGGSIGKCNINSIDVSCNQQINTLTPVYNQSGFLKTVAQSPYFQYEVKSDSYGLATPIISKGKWEIIFVPLPPLAEQKAIVKIVNQLMGEVDQLEAQTKTRVQLRQDFIQSSLRQLTTADSSSEWKKLQPQFTSFFDTVESIDKLKEAILQLAVQGKLTKQWRKDNPDVESATVLLEKIKEEKARLVNEKKIKKDKSLPEILEEEIPFDLPEMWTWFRFQEVFDIRDGTHDSPKDSLDPDSYPLITSKNFKNGYIDFDSARRISKADYLKVINRSKVHKGDILFSMIGGNIGNQVEVGEQTDFAIKNVALFKHYKYGMPAPGFLRILSKFLAMDLQNQAAGGAQPFVSLKYFRNLIFALPPQEEQNEIIVIVAQLMGYCDQMKTEIENRNILSKDFLRSSIREVMEKTQSLT